MNGAPLSNGWGIDGGGGTVTLVMRNALAREGLRRILADGGYAITRVGADTTNLNSLSWTRDDLVIIDSDTFDVAGFDPIPDTGADVEMPRLVVIAHGFDVDTMLRVFAAGGHGYLSGQDSHQSFLIKLALVRLGEKVMPSAFLETLVRLPGLARPAPPAAWDASVLDMRGQAVLAGLVQGMSNRTIACELCLSELTVKLTVRAVLRKLQVSNRTQAAIKARDCEAIQRAWENSCGLKLSGPRSV